MNFLELELWHSRLNRHLHIGIPYWNAGAGPVYFAYASWKAARDGPGSQEASYDCGPGRSRDGSNTGRCRLSSRPSQSTAGV